MGVSDELAALRQSGMVKSKSSRLSSQVSKNGLLLTSPEEEARKLRLKSILKKQYKLDATQGMHRPKGAGMSDLNLLYKKLMMDEKKKKMEAKRNLMEWKRKHPVGKKKEGGEGEEGAEDDDDDDDTLPPMPDDAEVIMNEDALEMLPEHVVSALKEKYDTEDGAAALSLALKDESEHGQGVLAQLMDATDTEGEGGESIVDEEGGEVEEKKEAEEEETKPVVEDKKPEPIAEEEEEEEEKPEPVAEEKEPQEAVAEEKEEEKPEPVAQEKEPPVVEEEAKPDEPEPTFEEEVMEEKVEESATVEVEEAREEFEQLTIKDSKEEVEEIKPEESPKPEEPPTPEPAKPRPDLSNIDKILQTQTFYNTHSQEYIDNISPQTNLAPSAHRDAFLAHVHLQQLMNASDLITMLDLGCGYGRDALHFSNLGHHVLGVDSSINMLNAAKKVAPKVHYLNMDMRALSSSSNGGGGGVLVNQSLDGVWAHASLFHLPKGDVKNVLKGLFHAVKVGGVLYMSLKIGNSEDQMAIIEDGEAFDVDERYAAIDKDIVEGDGVCDSRRKLYCYYTTEEVKELVAGAGWEVTEIGVDDQRGVSDYVKHSMVYVFATRRNE